ncbi:hypothetical protein WJX73_004965 [Symbiochloris irregularis]|uniref:F-box domain-containing protein n=1 Tax=Symbiochloris irregularis TaxID=706552 RepID=A0AAW1NRY8_9CHLO
MTSKPRHPRAGIALPEMPTDLLSHICRNISLRDLANLACTSKAMRASVYNASMDGAWRRLATAHLPPLHPSLEGKGRAAVQAIMEHRAQAHRNIVSGKTGATMKLPRQKDKAFLI